MAKTLTNYIVTLSIELEEDADDIQDVLRIILQQVEDIPDVRYVLGIDCEEGLEEDDVQ